MPLYCFRTNARNTLVRRVFFEFCQSCIPSLHDTVKLLWSAPPRSCSCITIICNESKSQPSSKRALTRSKLTCAALSSDLKSMSRACVCVCVLTALCRRRPNDWREQKMVYLLDLIRWKSVMLDHKYRIESLAVFGFTKHKSEAKSASKCEHRCRRVSPHG